MNWDVFMASNSWWAERKEKGAHHWISKNLPYLFDTLDALYPETRKLPLKSPGVRMEAEVRSSYAFTCTMLLSVHDYTRLRLIISLTGDLYNLLTPLVKVDPKSLMELSESIKELYDYSTRFREVRNFFTHLDEVLTYMDKHGISGPINAQCGLRYTESARACVHLIWDNNSNTIYFTFRKKEWTIRIDKPAFQPIFQTARKIYAELISHKPLPLGNDYTPVENLYPY